VRVSVFVTCHVTCDARFYDMIYNIQDGCICVCLLEAVATAFSLPCLHMCGQFFCRPELLCRRLLRLVYAGCGSAMQMTRRRQQEQQQPCSSRESAGSSSSTCGRWQQQLTASQALSIDLHPSSSDCSRAYLEQACKCGWLAQSQALSLCSTAAAAAAAAYSNRQVW
jgi:hypothetical protein